MPLLPRLLLLASLCFLPLHAEPPAAPAPQTTAPATEHPFLEWNGPPQWSKLTVEQAKKDLDHAMRQYRERVRQLENITDPTYENTFGELANIDENLERLCLRLEVLSSLCNETGQRDAVTGITTTTQQGLDDVLINEKIWKILKKADACEWAKHLTPEQNRYKEQIMDFFRKNGGDLSPEGKKRLVAINQELLALSSRFASNALDSANSWKIVIKDRSRLAGLPYSTVRYLQSRAQEQGFGDEEHPQWLVTAQDGSAYSILAQGDDPKLREEIWRSLQTIGRGKHDNAPLIGGILQLRHEKACLLGYANYAEMSADDRMVGTAAHAAEFLQTIHDSIMPAYRQEMATLRRLKREHTGNAEALLDPWDVAYYGHQLYETQADDQKGKLDSYLRADHVIQGMFDIFSGLYGLTVTERPTACIASGSGKTAPEGTVEVWDPAVRYYEIRDTASGEHIGSFYMDMNPRDNKRDGIWMQTIESGSPPRAGHPRIPRLAAICSYTGIGTKTRPTTMSPEDIQALFHEFGHTLHHCLSEVGIRDLSGTNTVLDFVEFPSQINENWVWEREALNRFAKQRTTGRPLPDKLYRSMLASQNFLRANSIMNQCAIAHFDLEVHMNYEKYKDMPPERIEREILAGYCPETTEHAPIPLYDQTHLFVDNYGAGYYAYLWGEMLTTDAFSKFKEKGILNPEVGAEFRRCILSKGNSKPAIELYRDFMGRDPKPDAFIRKLSAPGEPSKP